MTLTKSTIDAAALTWFGEMVNEVAMHLPRVLGEIVVNRISEKEITFYA